MVVTVFGNFAEKKNLSYHENKVITVIVGNFPNILLDISRTRRKNRNREKNNYNNIKDEDIKYDQSK